MLEVKRIKVDMGGVAAKLNRITTDKATGTFAASEAARLMQEYVPEREGILKIATPRPWKVIYTTPYAAKQYYGNYRHPKPGAISHWDRALDRPALARAIQAYIKMRG